MTETLIQPYDPAWPAWFEQIRTVLQAALADTYLTIEHVGSTAVPGLSAKPIIDLDIVIAPVQFATIKDRLARLGYQHEGDLGIIGREAFNLPPHHRLKTTLPAHHLYVCPQDSPELKRHLYFRERMKAVEAERRYYDHKKRQIAALCDHDKKLYAQVKGLVLHQFFTQILAELEPAPEIKRTDRD